MVRSYRALWIAATLLAYAPSHCFAQLEPDPAQLVSVGFGSTVPDSLSRAAVVAPNGDVVVFQSEATNLVRNDSNEKTDIFLRAPSGAISRLSVSEAGEQGNDDSEEPAVSQLESDGSYAVVFASMATNLVDNGPVEVRHKQIYITFPKTKKMFLVSRSSSGQYGDGDSFNPTILSVEAGEKYLVAFSSRAHNLDEGGIIGGPTAVAQILVAVVSSSGTVERIRSMKGPGGVVPNGDNLSPKFSGTGDKMVFMSSATNMGFTNPQGYRQIVLATKESTSFRVLSKSPTGELGNQSSDIPSISFDGTKVAFRTYASNIFNSSAGSPTYVLYKAGEELSVINSDSNGVRRESPAMPWVNLDPSGRFVAFHSGSPELVAGDTNDRDDVFVKDLDTGSVVIAAKNSQGAQQNGETHECSIGALSYSGTTLNLSYFSTASNLSALSSPNHGQVYRTKLDFPPAPLAPDTTIQSPPDVRSTQPKQLIITLQKFSGVSFSSIRAFWQGEVESKANKITYDVRLTRSSTKKVQKTTSSRNRVAFRNLTPGKYTVKYRVNAANSSGKSITTKFSPSRSVVVKSK